MSPIDQSEMSDVKDFITSAVPVWIFDMERLDGQAGLADDGKDDRDNVTGPQSLKVDFDFPVFTENVKRSAIHQLVQKDISQRSDCEGLPQGCY